MSRFLILVPALFLSVTSPSEAGEQEAQTTLARPTPAVDPDATGRLEMEREGRGEQEFQVEIQQIDTASGIYTLWIESGVGTAAFLNAGDFVADGPDEAEYEREIGDKESGSSGGGLPLGVNDLRELQNRDVEVRDASGATILIGTIPAFGSSGGGGEEERELPLSRPANEPIPEAEGSVSVEIDEGESELEIETEGFDVSTIAYSVWIEDAAGVLQNVGNLVPEEEDEGELSWDTEKGQSLPFGAATVRELGGRGVEIRDPQDIAVLLGSIPTLGGASPSVLRNRSRLTTTTAGEPVDAKGRIAAQFHMRQGRFLLRIDSFARTNDAEASLWIADPVTGQMERAATGAWSGRKTKKVRWEWRSDRSQPLPLGVTDPSRLFGQAIEVRDESGAVILSGRL